LGSSSTILVSGVLSFASHSIGDPINQLSLSSLVISGLEPDDWSVAGGISCTVSPVFQGPLLVLQGALHDRMGDSVCGIEGPALFGQCPP
jgi:hypothetical protein